MEDVEGFHAADGDGDAGETHGVAESFLGGDRAVRDDFAAAAEAFHAEDAETFLRGDGEDLSFEAAEGGVETVERHLHGVEREVCGEHAQMDAGIFVAGEADEADFALFLRFGEGFGGAAGGEDQFGIVVVDDFVDLPEIEMIGLQAAQGFFEHLHGDVFVAAVGADFGHEEGLVAFAFQGDAEFFFADAVVVFPGVVEEVDAGVDGAWRRFRWLLLGFWWRRGDSRRRRERRP